MQLLASTTSPYVRIAQVSMIEKGLNVEPTIVNPWADDGSVALSNFCLKMALILLNNYCWKLLNATEPFDSCMMSIQSWRVNSPPLAAFRS